MTTPVVNPINQVTASAGQPTFTYTFKINQISDIVVFKLVATTEVITQLAEGVDYTVQNVGAPGGGTITPIGPQAPTLVGDIWTLIRQMKVFRENDFSTSGDFFALTVNEQLDYLTQIAQDRERDNNIAVKLDPALLESLDPLIPKPIDGRSLAIQSSGPNAFRLVMGPENGLAIPGFYQNVLTITANTVLDSGNNGDLIVVDTTAGNIEVTLPELPGTLDFRVGIAKTTADSNIVIIKPSGTNTINGATVDINQATKDKIINYVGDAATENFTASDLSLAFPGLYKSVLTISANTVLTLTNKGDLIVVNTSSGNIEVTLPDVVAGGFDFSVGVSKSTGDANTVTVKRSGSDTINGIGADIVQTVKDKIINYVGDEATANYTASDLSTGIPALVNDPLPKLGNRLDTNFFAIEESQGATVASASETDIWAGDGNTRHISGTTQIDNFAFPFGIGQKRTIIFDDVLILKNGNIKLPGGQDILTEAGDRADVYVNNVDDYSVEYHRINQIPGFTFVGPINMTPQAVSFTLLDNLINVNEIFIAVQGWSSNTGNRQPKILLGTPTIITAGYSGIAMNADESGTASNVVRLRNNSSEAGFLIGDDDGYGSGETANFSCRLNRVGFNIWNFDAIGDQGGNRVNFGAGQITLAGPLVKVILTTRDGQATANTIDAGVAHIRFK